MRRPRIRRRGLGSGSESMMLRMVQGRTNRAQLVRCVGLLYEAWREALQAIGALTHDGVWGSPEVENEEEEEDGGAEEELDAQEFAEQLARQLESWSLETLGLLLEQEEEGEASNSQTRPEEWQ